MTEKFPEEKSVAMCQRIKQFYEERSITPSTFARKIGVERARLYKVLSDGPDFQVSLLYRIKDAYPEFDIDWCLFGDEVPTSNVINNKGIFLQNSSNNQNIVAGSVEDMKQTILEQMNEICKSNDFYRDMVKKVLNGMFDMSTQMNGMAESFKSIVSQLREAQQTSQKECK